MELMEKLGYTLLVDETGVDGTSKRLMYVGCLFETAELAAVERAIVDFNREHLDDPLYSGKPGLVNVINEPRHFVDDNESLRVKFIDEVIRRLPFRLYAVFDIPTADVRQSKVDLFKSFIGYVKQVREIGQLQIIVEKSGDDKYLKDYGAVFRDKSYLPLSVADYCGGVLHRFHEKRLELLAGGALSRARDVYMQLAYKHYAVLIDRMSFERDLSTKETSSRRTGRYFLDQIHGIVSSD